MNHPSVLAALTVLTLTAGLLFGTPCRAALGADAASVAVDQDALHGEVSATVLPRYRIQEIRNAQGMRVREYLDGAGQVFAVTWSGPAVPDLRPLLGAYFDEYQAALRKLNSAGLQRSLRIVGPSVTVELSGHLRAYSGRAYLPARLPAQVNRGELQ